MVGFGDAARERRLFFAIFAVAWICAVVPLWAARALPLVDFPSLLDAVAVHHRLHDARWGYAKYYDLKSIPLPYWAYFWPVDLLSYLFPIEIANKIYLTIYAALLPLSVAALAERMGRSRWLALFSFPLVFNVSLGFGFIGFCFGLALLNFALVAVDAFLVAPTARRAIAVALLALALYASGVLPALFFAAATLVLVACHRPPARRAVAAIALELPSLVLLAIGFSRAPSDTPAGPLGFDLEREPLLLRLRNAPIRVLVGYDHQGSVYWMLLVLAAVWLVLLWTTRRDEDSPPPRDYRVELLFALALLGYFALPTHLHRPVDLWLAAARFMTPVAIFGALLPTGNFAGARRFLLVPVLAIALAHPITMAVGWARYDQRVNAFRRLMHDVPQGSSTLVLMRGNRDESNSDPHYPAVTQYHAYAQYLSGGYDPWARGSEFPFTAKADRELPAPSWDLEQFDFQTQAMPYDYVVTKGEQSDHQLLGPDNAWRAPLAARDGEYRLYKVNK